MVNQEPLWQELIDTIQWRQPVNFGFEYYYSYFVIKWFGETCRTLTRELNWAEILQKKPDFIVIDTIFHICAHLIPAIFDVPYAITLGISPPQWTAVRQGLPITPSYIVSQLRGYSHTMSFRQRVVNTMDAIMSPIWDDMAIHFGLRTFDERTSSRFNDYWSMQAGNYLTTPRKTIIKSNQ